MSENAGGKDEMELGKYKYRRQHLGLPRLSPNPLLNSPTQFMMTFLHVAD